MSNTQTLNQNNINRIIQAAKLGDVEHVQNILDEQKLTAIIEEAEACKTFITQQELRNRLQEV